MNMPTAITAVSFAIAGYQLGRRRPLASKAGADRNIIGGAPSSPELADHNRSAGH